MGARITAALSWIASIPLALLAAFSFVLTTDPPIWHSYVAGACMGAAAIMLFPPVWKAQAGETVVRRRVRITAAAALAVIGLFMPVTSHVTIPLPYAVHH